MAGSVQLQAFLQILEPVSCSFLIFVIKISPFLQYSGAHLTCIGKVNSVFLHSPLNILGFRLHKGRKLLKLLYSTGHHLVCSTMLHGSPSHIIKKASLHSSTPLSICRMSGWWPIGRLFSGCVTPHLCLASTASHHFSAITQ